MLVGDHRRWSEQQQWRLEPGDVRRFRRHVLEAGHHREVRGGNGPRLGLEPLPGDDARLLRRATVRRDGSAREGLRARVHDRRRVPRAGRHVRRPGLPARVRVWCAGRRRDMRLHARAPAGLEGSGGLRCVRVRRHHLQRRLHVCRCRAERMHLPVSDLLRAALLGRSSRRARRTRRARRAPSLRGR